MFVVAGKRYGEYREMGEDRADTRAPLGLYTLPYLQYVWMIESGEFYGLAATNKHIVLPLARLFEFTDGLIGHERRFYDFTGLLVQVGVLRAKPAG